MDFIALLTTCTILVTFFNTSIGYAKPIQYTRPSSLDDGLKLKSNLNILKDNQGDTQDASRSDAHVTYDQSSILYNCPLKISISNQVRVIQSLKTTRECCDIIQNYDKKMNNQDDAEASSINIDNNKVAYSQTGLCSINRKSKQPCWKDLNEDAMRLFEIYGSFNDAITSKKSTINSEMANQVDDNHQKQKSASTFKSRFENKCPGMQGNSAEIKEKKEDKEKNKQATLSQKSAEELFETLNKSMHAQNIDINTLKTKANKNKVLGNNSQLNYPPNQLRLQSLLNPVNQSGLLIENSNNDNGGDDKKSKMNDEHIKVIYDSVDYDANNANETKLLPPNFVSEHKGKSKYTGSVENLKIDNTTSITNSFYKGVYMNIFKNRKNKNLNLIIDGMRNGGHLTFRLSLGLLFLVLMSIFIIFIIKILKNLKLHLCDDIYGNEQYYNQQQLPKDQVFFF